MKIPSVFGLCMRESPKDWPLIGATPFSPSPHHSCLAYSSLCIYSASFPINSPNLSPLTAPLVVWAVWPRCFPQVIRRLLFKCLHRADVPIHTPLPAHPLNAETFLCPREYIMLLLCVWSGEYRAGTRESHTDDCLACKLLGVCVFLLPLFPLQLWADVLNWPIDCSFSGPLHQCFILFPCFRLITICPRL